MKCGNKKSLIQELNHALMDLERPSEYFESLRTYNKLSEMFPELYALIGIQQNPVHHPEGDVWNHTMQVIDNAVKYRDKVEHPFWFMVSALVHDFGKIVSTEEINGVIHAYKHETMGLPIIKAFLDRLTDDDGFKEYVLNMAELHMKPNILAGVQASVKSTNRMFDSSIEPKALIYLSAADSAGKTNTDSNLEFLLKRLDIYNEYMSRPYVTAEELIAVGLAQHEDMDDILSHAHKLRLAGVDKENALKQVLGYAKHKNSEYQHD